MHIHTIPTGKIQANSYLLVDETGSDALLIDCGAAEAKLLTALEGVKLRAILLTHGHWDHILGVAEIKERFGADVAIHNLDAPRLADPSVSGADKFGIEQTPLMPDVEFGDGDTITYGNITLKILHTPGHTKGSVCFIHEPSRSIFSGDTLFYHTVGRTDLLGGDRDTMRASLLLLRDLPGDYDVYPGHDRATTLDEERARNRYMRRVLQ